MVKAYLDSYKTITIYVSKNYYDGKLTNLILKYEALDEEEILSLKNELSIECGINFNN